MINEQNLEETKLTTNETGGNQENKIIPIEKYNTISSFSNQKIKNKKKQLKIPFKTLNTFKGKKHKNIDRYFPERL